MKFDRLRSRQFWRVLKGAAIGGLVSICVTLALIGFVGGLAALVVFLFGYGSFSALLFCLLLAAIIGALADAFYLK